MKPFLLLMALSNPLPLSRLCEARVLGRSSRGYPTFLEKRHLRTGKQFLILKNADHGEIFSHEKGPLGVGPTSSCTT